MKKLFPVLFIFLVLGIYSCKDDPVTPPPPPPDPVILNDTITLSLSDVTHRSLTINVSTTQNNPESGIKLYRISNSTETLLSEYSIDIKDTAIIDDNNGAGLELNTEYSYYAVRIDSLGEKKDTSNIVSGITLNATSHEYTWEEFIIGEFQSSLYDVWGTDENNVWAVGTCRLNDTAYGVLKWDGNSWQTEKRIGGLQAIYGFSETDIWAVGGGVWYYNGIEWKKIDAKSVNNQLIPLDSVLFYNATYTSIWGTSSSNLYLGNDKGKIIHWDGKKAKVINDFGVYIYDIYGTSENNIWITGSTTKPLLSKYDGSAFEEITNLPPIQLPMYTVFPLPNQIYVGGNGVFRKENNNWTIEAVNRSLGGTYRIRGTNSNNIFTVGAYCTVNHFNGLDWKYYDQLRTPEGGIQYGVYVTEKKVFIVGINSDHYRAKILVGTKK